MIGIINYGMGNIASVKNALDHIGEASIVINSIDDFDKVKKLILPGVGAFRQAMENIKKLNFDSKITQEVNGGKKPILGICLGMQLLLSSSEEFGSTRGLDLVSGSVIDFKGKVNGLNIPHVGWNNVKSNNNDLITNEFDNDDYYFVHSFYCSLDNESEVSGITDYGIPFHSTLQKGIIYGCQFHPEKSQKAGLSIFNQFAKL